MWRHLISAEQAWSAAPAQQAQNYQQPPEYGYEKSQKSYNPHRTTTRSGRRAHSSKISLVNELLLPATVNRGCACQTKCVASRDNWLLGN